MCHNQSLFMTFTLIPFVAYDMGFGITNFYFWTKAKGFQSFKALGTGAAILCLAAGALYGIWATISSQLPTLLCASTLLYLYPIFEFLRRRKKTKWHYILCLPMALYGILLWLLVFSAICSYFSN